MQFWGQPPEVTGNSEHTITRPIVLLDFGWRFLRKLADLRRAISDFFTQLSRDFFPPKPA